jgi:two-component system sensor histidine kinase RegB
MTDTVRARQSAAAMRIDDVTATRPWYLGATPLATLPWLIRLRWATAAIEASIAAVVWLFPALDLPLDHLAPLLVIAAAVNAAIASWLAHGRAVPRPAAAAGLAVEVVLLTGLLKLTGGPSNPFAVVYVVQILLAALTLGAVWAWPLGGFAGLCFGVLVYWHTRELVPSHHRLNDFPTHLFTFWISAAVITELLAYFVVRVSDAHARREQELEAMRARAARTERLVSLTTLAAGAAHELSTPLATIALAARELERAATARGTVPDLAEDARLIRSEVDRCQAIIDQMSGRAGGSTADDPEHVDVRRILDDVRGRLAPRETSLVLWHIPADVPPVWVPRRGFAQALLSLVNNALEVTADDGPPVAVDVTHDGEKVRVTVQDRGPGLSAEGLRRAGEPFYTTKEPGRGLGLGVFLARVFAERLGGTLTLQSGHGTTAVLEIPVQSELAVQP